MIVDSIWFYPILGLVGIAIIYWFDQTWKEKNVSCLINEEILERLYEDFLEILAKDNKLPLEQREKEAARLAQEEFEKQQ